MLDLHASLMKDRPQTVWIKTRTVQNAVLPPENCQKTKALLKAIGAELHRERSSNETPRRNRVMTAKKIGM